MFITFPGQDTAKTIGWLFPHHPVFQRNSSFAVKLNPKPQTDPALNKEAVPAGTADGSWL